MAEYVEVIDLTEDNDLKEESSMIMNQFERSKSHQFGHFLIQNQVLKFINYINSSFFFLLLDINNNNHDYAKDY